MSKQALYDYLELPNPTLGRKSKKFSMFDFVKEKEQEQKLEQEQDARQAMIIEQYLYHKQRLENKLKSLKKLTGLEAKNYYVASHGGWGSTAPLAFDLKQENIIEQWNATKHRLQVLNVIMQDLNWQSNDMIDSVQRFLNSIIE